MSTENTNKIIEDYDFRTIIIEYALCITEKYEITPLLIAEYAEEINRYHDYFIELIGTILYTFKILAFKVHDYKCTQVELDFAMMYLQIDLLQVDILDYLRILTENWKPEIINLLLKSDYFGILFDIFNSSNDTKLWNSACIVMWNITNSDDDNAIVDLIQKGILTSIENAIKKITDDYDISTSSIKVRSLLFLLSNLAAGPWDIEVDSKVFWSKELIYRNDTIINYVIRQATCNQASIIIEWAYVLSNLLKCSSKEKWLDEYIDDIESLADILASDGNSKVSQIGQKMLNRIDKIKSVTEIEDIMQNNPAFNL